MSSRLRSLTRLGFVCGIVVLLSPRSSADELDDLFVIEGRVQKPSVEFFISRENLSEDFDIEVRESFLFRIFDALNAPPF